MRHLNTPAGLPDPDLTAEGRATALRLANWFKEDPPQIIYVSNTKRARQTAEPLAAKFHLTPKTYNPADTPGLVAAVLAERATVLIVGHSNTVPDIIERLGGQRPGELHHEDFGDIWHVSGPARTTVHSRLTD
jgi:broad specificity phosphatase PhoE